VAAVGGEGGDVVEAEPLEDLARLEDEAAEAVHGVDAPGEQRQDRGLVAGAGSDLEHLVAGMDVEAPGSSGRPPKAG
jgi:hypothetical protein